MRPSQALSSLVVLLLFASSSASVLEDTCRSFPITGSYDICMKFFQADKGSATADKRGLAAIATRIAGATAVVNRMRIAALKAGEKDPKIQGNLAYCDKLYSAAPGLLDEAAKGISSGKLGDAVKSISSALDIPEGCEAEFRKAGVKSPASDEDLEFEMECAITLGVTRLLTDSVVG